MLNLMTGLAIGQTCSVQGDAEVCGGGNYSYLAPPLPSIQFSYQWNITGGVPAAATGNPLAVTWADPLPQGSQIALSVTDITTGCQSVPFVLPVNPIPVVAPLVEGPRKNCLNTISTYQIGNWASMNCNKVEWSISPPSAGSIISGFMDPVMSVQWNNAVNANVVLWLTTYTCGVQDNYPIYINLNKNTLPVTVTPNPACEGVPATIDIATASSHAPLPLPSYQWSIESGTGYANFTSTSVPIQHTFSLYQHPNPVFNGSVIAHYNDVNDLLSVNNCETGTFNVTVLPKPSVNINASSIYVCPGPIILDAPPGFISYQWSNGANSPQTTVTQTGMYTVTVTDIYGCTGIGFIELYDCPCFNDPRIPVNQFTHTIANCITRTVEFSVSGNYNPAYIYDFSYGDGAHEIITTFSPFPTAVHSYSMPGTYTVCLKVIDPLPDPDHCYEWCTQVVIPLSAAFTMDIDCPSPDPSMYSVTFVNLSYSVNPATYSWKVGGVPFSNATDPVVQWPAGTYVVELTATSGNDQCTISGTVDIPAVPAPPLFTITGDPFCEKQTPVNFDYSGGPASQIASALWQFGDQTESKLFPHTERVFDNTLNNPYTNTLYITDLYGCPFNHNEDIEIILNGLTGHLKVTPDPFCAGSSAAVEYDQGVSSTTPTHYLWSDGQTTNPAIAFEAGNWMVTVSDLGPGHSGCTEVFGPLNIGMFNIPVPYFTGDGNLCSGELLFLEGYYGASYNYTWTVDPPFLGLPSTTPPWQYALNTINENPGTYLVTLTLEDPVNACVRTYTGQITIGDIPPQPVISANPPILCAGTPTVLDITNNPSPPNQYNVNWSTGVSSNSITVTASNIYMATFTNQAGCTQSSSVTMNDVPNLDWVVMGCYDYCANETVVIPGNPNIIYQNWEWLVNGIIVDSDNNTTVNDLNLNQLFGSPLPVGIYTVQLVVTDVNNCTTWSEPITITIRQCPCNIERVISQLRCIGVDANNIAHYFFDFSVQYNFPPATNNIQLVSNDPCFGVALNPVTNPFQLTGILSVNLSCGADPKVICLRLLYNDPPHNSCVFDFCVPLPVCQNPVLCGVEFNPFEVLCNGTDFAGNPVYSFNFDLNPVAGNFNVFFSSPHGQVTGFPASIGPGAGPYSGTITDTPPLTVPGGLFCIQMNVWSDNPVDAVCHERFCFSLPVCGSGDPDRGTPVQGNNHLPQSPAEGAGVRLSPNPVHDRLDILCTLPSQETGWLTIEDMRGNPRWVREVTDPASPIRVEVNSFPSGIYVVSLRGKSFPKVIKKLVILK